MSLITDAIRASASIKFIGEEICQVKTNEFIMKMGFPNGFMPLKKVVEFGHVEKTGFTWFIQKERSEHTFKKIGKRVQYAAEVTGYYHYKKIKKMSGVKSRDFMLWVSITDIFFDDPPTGKITFKSSTGISRSLPASAFEDESLPIPVLKVENKGADDRAAKEATAPAAKVAVSGGGAAAAAAKEGVAGGVPVEVDKDVV